MSYDNLPFQNSSIEIGKIGFNHIIPIIRGNALVLTFKYGHNEASNV